MCVCEIGVQVASSADSRGSISENTPVPPGLLVDTSRLCLTQSDKQPLNRGEQALVGLSQLAGWGCENLILGL